MRRALLAVAILVAVAPLSGAHGAGSYRIRVDPGVRFAAVWSPSARATPGCPLHVGVVFVEPNAWNLRPATRGGACVPSATPTGSTTGSIAWKSGPGGFRLSVALDRTQRVHPAIPVAAYPELIYGWSPYLGAASPQQAALRFPIRVDALVRRRPNPMLTTVYRICSSCLHRGKIDFAYDLWISPDAAPRWCGHGSPPPARCIPAPSRAIEVMIWLAHSPGFRAAGRLAPTATLSTRVWLDGKRTDLRFRAFVCERCPHGIVSFVLTGTPTVRMPLGLARGSLSLFVDDFLARAIRTLRRTPARAGYLDGIELGAEVAPLQDGAATRFWLALQRYCLQALPQATAGSGSACS